MISLSIGLVITMVGFSAYLVATGARRGNRFAAVEAFAPGGTVAGLVQSRRRRTKNLARVTSETVDRHLPDQVELMAVALQSGESLQAALELIATTSRGPFADALRQSQVRLQLGSSLDQELQILCVELPTAGVKEFASKLAIAINRGTPLAGSLSNLATTLRRRAANQLLRQAGSNETKMLIPLVAIVLPLTVVFAIYPSSAILQIGF
ncbi:MAG: type II secretion system F family protein [Micrococcales bacterium]